MQLVVISLLSFVAANATLDKSGHMMYVEYSISEPTKDQGVVYVDILFHDKGETYKVARHRYPEPITSIVDTFPWVSKDKWEGGDLEVVARKADGSVERSYISESSIEVRELGYQLPKFEHEVNGALVKVNNGPDPYAWRMLGYDPGHTGYYPYSLYPPLELKWILRDWGHPGSWITEVSGAAGHDMLFIPKSVRQWNIITARDIETGEIIWQRYVTANAWTSALSLDDSTLFVGTSIGFTPWQDTTFYALDPFTGELKWGKALKTVEYSPIVVDSFVYAPHFYKVYCFTYGGDSLWAANGGYTSPVYEDGIIVGAATDSVLTARDWLTGDLLWNFVVRGKIMLNPLLYENEVIFTPANDALYALNAISGQIEWINRDYPRLNFHPPHGAFGIVFIGAGRFINDSVVISYLYFIDSNNGFTLWDSTFRTIENAVGGGCVRLLTTKDSLLWYAKTDVTYLLRIPDHQIIYSTPMPLNNVVLFASINFPIFYKNHFIYANEDFLVVYEADTVDTSGQDTLAGFQVYLLYTDGDPVLRLNMPDEGQINLKLFSIAGREVWEKQAYFEKGSHFIDLPSLPSGVYVLFYDFEGDIGTKKVVLLRQRGK